MSLLLRHCPRRLSFKNPLPFVQIPIRPLSTSQTPDPRSNLSARLSFVFDQIDAIDNNRSVASTSDKFDALQRIRQWRESRNQEKIQTLPDPDANKAEPKCQDANMFVAKKDVEVVHPWPEWIELMERLGQQNYFDWRRRREDEVAESVGIELGEMEEETAFDFARDWTTVRNACMNFGKDRFDILRSLSKKDIQILVGHGCPSMDPKVVFSAKLLRKYTHLDEGDVCSSCSLRNSCSRGYILTLKEDEARTLDVMRVLLTYGFDRASGTVENKPLMQMKSVKTVVRKLLHEIVKLSAVPIDPNLPPPIIKKPPPKVKQPPPQPKKRVGRDDVEMKKGDWLCPKCDFMNFAKNTVCLQCDAKRPKRQLLPGEWECPQCNFLNYRRNMACFHCEAKRPPDEFTENQLQPKQSGPRMRPDRAARVQDVSNAWNFDFDDNESDGADVAAFEFADSKRVGGSSDLDGLPHGRSSASFEEDMRNPSRTPKTRERGRYFSDDEERKPSLDSDRTGFDDFDDEEDDVDSYELDGSNNSQARDVSTKSFSEIDNTSGSEGFDDFDRHNRGTEDYISGSEDDDLADHPQLKSSHVAESWRKSGRRGGKSLVSDDDFGLGSDYDDDIDDEDFGSKQRKNRQQSSDRKGTSKRRKDSDSDDELLLNSDSDGDDGDLFLGRNKMRGNKGQSDRRSNDRKSSDYGNARRGEFRSDDGKNNRRNSFGNQDNDLSSKGSRHNGDGGGRENNRFQRFDRTDDGNRRQVSGRRRDNDRSQCFDRADEGNRRNGYGGRRDNDRSQRFDRTDGGRQGYGGRRDNDRSQRFDRADEGNRRNGYGGRRDNDRFQRSDMPKNGNRRRERSNQFSDRSSGSRRDDRGAHGNGYSGWGGDDGFQPEITNPNRFRDRNRSSGNESPRTRNFER